MNTYKHTQIGYLLITALGAGILMAGYLIMVTSFNPVAFAAMVFLLICLGIFATLTVEVNDQMLKIQFGFGVIHKVFALKEIESYRPVKNPWYYGWGIRFIGSGWLYNVSGTDAVELVMKNGKKVRVGTDDAEGPLQAVSVHLPKK